MLATVLSSIVAPVMFRLYPPVTTTTTRHCLQMAANSLEDIFLFGVEDYSLSVILVKSHEINVTSDG